MRAIIPLSLLLACLPVCGQDALETITADELLEHIQYLSDDALEGRDSGSEGERLAAAYIVEAFEALGLTPAGTDGTWFQPFEVDGLDARNVVGLLEGSDPELKDEVVVIGGHYDHVGHGHFGSRWGADGAGLIHNGADDNASGTAAVLEIAEAFVEGGLRPSRSLLFILFSGEERGLVGSQHFVAHPTVEHTMVAMLNLDMVGRGEGVGRFMVNGTRTAREFPALVAELAETHGCEPSTLGFGVAPSDNTSFYRQRIPVLFLTTGTHPEYHGPDDDWPLINTANCEALTRYACALTMRLAEGPRPRFQWAELKARSYLDGLRYLLREQLQGSEEAQDAWLGVRVDDGLRLSEVVEGSPAAAAGLRTGDRLRTVDGAALEDFAGLRDAVRARAPGQLLLLGIEREGAELAVEVRLGARP